MLKKIEIFIVDDSEDWLRVISESVNRERDLKVIGIAANKEDTINYIRQNDVDVILLGANLRCNSYDGIDVLVDIMGMKKDIKVIMVTSLKNEELIKKSFLAGAVNYVLKDDYLELPDIIRKTHRENLAFGVILRGYRELLRDKYIKIETTLTPCEKELLDKKQEGFSNRELAERLNKSESTIKSQTRSILKKFNGKSLKEVITVRNILNNIKY